MLQAALLLLGCALSRYLWEINITVASVVVGVTSFGIIFYLFIVVAGTAYESCPYQTPGAHILRHILLPTFHSAPSIISKFAAFAFSKFSDFIRFSATYGMLVKRWQSLKLTWYLPVVVIFSLSFALVMLPIALAIDVYLLGQVLLWLLIILGRTIHCWFMGMSSPQTHGVDQQTIVLDLRCISWMLKTSLDEAVHLSTLKHLATVTTLAGFDPTLVGDCLSIFISCVNVSHRKVAIIQGLEQLATVSAACFLRTFDHLSVVDPTSSVLEGLRQRYIRVFPLETDFRGLPFRYTMAKIHGLVTETRYHRLTQYYRYTRYHRLTQWGEHRPSAQEHIPIARDMVEGAQVEYQNTQPRKVPRWILRFALHSLSLDPPPPTPVVANCLSIIAIDLGCDVSETELSHERCVHVL